MTALSIFLGEITPMKVVLIIVIILLLFGGKKIPELMKGLGSGLKEFKNAAREDKPANEDPVSTDPIAPSSPLTPPPSVHKDDSEK